MAGVGVKPSVQQASTSRAPLLARLKALQQQLCNGRPRTLDPGGEQSIRGLPLAGDSVYNLRLQAGILLLEQLAKSNGHLIWVCVQHVFQRLAHNAALFFGHQDAGAANG